MNLKAVRKDFKFTQQEVAQELGIKVAAYSKLERGIIQLSVDRLMILSSLFNLSPQEIIFYDNKTKASDSYKNKNITYVPIAAQAGLLSNFLPQQSNDVGIRFSLPVFYEEDLFLINLEGDSMYPTFCNGDFLVVRQVAPDYQIKWGEPYLIITDDGQVVKRVMKSTSNSKLLLKSDNELYEPYEIEKSIVRTIWELKGVISKNLAPKTVR